MGVFRGRRDHDIGQQGSAGPLKLVSEAKNVVIGGQQDQKGGQWGSAGPKGESAELSMAKKWVSRAQQGQEVGQRGSAELNMAKKWVSGAQRDSTWPRSVSAGLRGDHWA